LFYSFLEESEEDLIDRFWRGLNQDIQDLIMDEELYSVAQLFRLGCRAEQKIRRRVHMANKCAMESPSPTLMKDNFYPIPPTMIAVPTTVERESQGNNIGNGFLPTHEIDHCHDDLNMPCLELDVDALDTQLVIEDSINLNMTCVQINEIDSGLSAPSADLNSSIVTGA
jgi:hypothetical protein